MPRSVVAPACDSVGFAVVTTEVDEVAVAFVLMRFEAQRHGWIVRCLGQMWATCPAVKIIRPGGLRYRMMDYLSDGTGVVGWPTRPHRFRLPVCNQAGA